MIRKEITFKTCKRGDHKDCRREIIKEDLDDVSQPQTKLVCNCNCHQVLNKVPAIYKMYLKECREGRHNECPKQFSVKETKSTFYCKCSCHTR